MSTSEPRRFPSELRVPAPEFAGEPLDLVFIEGLCAETVIGIHQSELHVPQPVRIDITLGTPRALACRTDRIGDTIDYSEVHAAVLGLLAGHRFRLLEALAEEIARRLLEDFGAHWVRVAAAKPGKFDDVDAVGVVIERRRVAEPRREASVLTLIGSGMVPGKDG